MDCKPLFNLVLNKNRTTKELRMLGKSQCSVKDQTVKVCCKINETRCYNPDGNLGNCVGVNDCPTITKILQPSISTESLNFIRNSRCEGPVKYSFCCGPNHETDVPASSVCAPSTSPPDPRTECCGLDSSNGNKIINGKEAAIDQYPWLALIEYRSVKGNREKLLCGGALISSKYVLTAAHCVVGKVLEKVTPKNIRLGEYNTSNSGRDCVKTAAGGQYCSDDPVTIPIEKIIPHPEYDPVSRLRRNDIALIRMIKNSPYTDFIRPICLPTSDVTQSNQNFDMYAAGWGAVSFEQSSSNIKLFVNLPYKPLEECQRAYKGFNRNLKLWDSQMCAGGEAGKDACRGDSGGPLMYDNGGIFSVVGIVSFGTIPCALKDVSGVFTKVYEYIPWIRSNIKP